MEIRGSQKYLLNKMSEQDYRTGIVQLMCILEEHSKEFKTPSELVALVHEYSELLTTIKCIDNPDTSTQDGSDIEDDFDEDPDDIEDDDTIGILYGVFQIPIEDEEDGDEDDD